MVAKRAVKIVNEPPAKLITIPISHYCERARWALHLAGISYKEEQHIQMFAWPYAWWHGGGKMVPVLKFKGQKALTDSADIVRYAHENRRNGEGLYPNDTVLASEVQAFERRFESGLGVEARRLMYWHFTRWGADVLRFNNADAPFFERKALELFFPVAMIFLKRYLSVSEQSARAADVIVMGIFDEVAALLSDGRKYLVGDRFSAADLTFATMAAAVLVPEQYGVRLPQPDEMPDMTAQLVRKYRAHPAGLFALDLYHKHHYQTD